MKPYLYETHLHTYPVSKCATADVKESLEFYKSLGYAGVFITNHFIDGNINYDKNASYEERIEFYFSDYEKGVQFGKDVGISVFLGIESSYCGTDFLIYGLDKAWFLKHPEIETMEKSQILTFMGRLSFRRIHSARLVISITSDCFPVTCMVWRSATPVGRSLKTLWLSIMQSIMN